MIFVLALGASLANALTSIFQRMGVEDAPASTTLRLGLLTYALRRKVWLLGFALMIVSFVLQAAALHLGRLSEVQPVLTTELVFLVIVLTAWFGFPVTRRELLGCLAVTAGLTGFLFFAHPEYGTGMPSTWDWIVTAGACAAAIAVTIAATRRGPAWWRAAMFGTGAAISFAFTSACTKAVMAFGSADFATLYRHWQAYALVIFGGLAVFLAQNAFHAGPIVASQSTIVLIDPLVSIMIGIGLFGDDLRTNGPWGPLEASSLLLMFAGAFWLSHSPLVSGIKGSGPPQQLSSRRSRPAHVPDAPPSSC
ncbi:MAG: DMT family transporter [Streptosporangiaceae bacterium]